MALQPQSSIAFPLWTACIYCVGSFAIPDCQSHCRSVLVAPRNSFARPLTRVLPSPAASLARTVVANRGLSSWTGKGPWYFAARVSPPPLLFPKTRLHFQARALVGYRDWTSTAPLSESFLTSVSCHRDPLHLPPLSSARRRTPPWFA